MRVRKNIAVGVVAAGSLAVAGVGTSLAAASSAKTHTLTFTAKQLKETDPTKTTFIDVDKDVKGGKVIGYDVVNGKFDPSAGTGKATVAVALKGGILYGKFAIDQQGNLSNGKVTGGTAKFNGATGAIQLSPQGKNAIRVTVTYHK